MRTLTYDQCVTDMAAQMQPIIAKLAVAMLVIIALGIIAMIVAIVQWRKRKRLAEELKEALEMNAELESEKEELQASKQSIVVNELVD